MRNGDIDFRTEKALSSNHSYCSIFERRAHSVEVKLRKLKIGSIKILMTTYILLCAAYCLVAVDMKGFLETSRELSKLEVLTKLSMIDTWDDLEYTDLNRTKLVLGTVKGIAAAKTAGWKTGIFSSFSPTIRRTFTSAYPFTDSIWEKLGLTTSQIQGGSFIEPELQGRYPQDCYILFLVGGKMADQKLPLQTNAIGDIQLGFENNLVQAGPVFLTDPSIIFFDASQCAPHNYPLAGVIFEDENNKELVFAIPNSYLEGMDLFLRTRVELFPRTFKLSELVNSGDVIGAEYFNLEDEYVLFSARSVKSLAYLKLRTIEKFFVDMDEIDTAVSTLVSVYASENASFAGFSNLPNQTIVRYGPFILLIVLWQLLRNLTTSVLSRNNEDYWIATDSTGIGKIGAEIYCALPFVGIVASIICYWASTGFVANIIILDITFYINEEYSVIFNSFPTRDSATQSGIDVLTPNLWIILFVLSLSCCRKLHRIRRASLVT